ncbi:MAG: V-type ATP synthase subunit K [Candidatus Lindowbacteria bacterium RIFCSPLOWO2_12_FULL_62_27]|nr:MAG: V-type ATP synthase subunit K [Candidatus Lindowbacteria bacterium RIFCSPLOWO2_12_FULL_62_27]OGH57469.1 MAG: V-type ATP synthase subunit K [Candidatus Lindowbacteria bacterium RIFCSPLOWO2_02_FULL_62_12]
MDAATIVSLGKFGGAAALGLAAVGSSMGSGIAGMAAVGAWKKCYAQNRLAPFLLVAFIGAPLSQTIYGMITMNNIVKAAVAGTSWPALIGAGFFGGLGMGASAWGQGMAGAAGADALAETGKGFGNYLIALGVIETVAIFVMIFIGKVIA